MIKAKFGASLSAKSETAQLNEVLTKIICHNVCVVAQATQKLGIEADFGLDSADDEDPRSSVGSVGATQGSRSALDAPLRLHIEA